MKDFVFRRALWGAVGLCLLAVLLTGGVHWAYAYTNAGAWALLLAAALLTAACYWGCTLLARRISAELGAQLQHIDRLLNGEEASGGCAFLELRPVTDNISAQIGRLRHNLEEVERTQRVRHDFVANASHELKSPLTSIRGFAELLAGGMGGERQAEYLKRIIDESNRLLAIIEDILLLSKAESGSPAQVTEVDLKATAEEIVQALELSAKKKGISLEAAGSGTVRANAQEMWELMYNLIDNGIRYGRENGYVRVRVEPGCVTVVDNGIGIAEDQQPRIFERFYRVEKSHARTAGGGGTGLGLSIARHICRKYGGDLLVESRLGEGSTFTAVFRGAGE